MQEIVKEILTSTNNSSAHGVSEGKTALHAAVVERHHCIFHVLLKAKPELIREVDYHGRTSLHYAASLSDLKTVKQLLHLDNTVAYVWTNMATHQFILRLAMKTEGLINQPDNDGNTPLHLATMGRKSWIVQYLIWDKRVEQRAKNKNGQTASDIDHSIRESCLTVPRPSPAWSIGEDIPPRAVHEAEEAKIQSYKQMAQTLIMVATLIATVTFAATFTMPGCYHQDGPKQGQAILDSSKSFERFVIHDIIAMTCSTTEASLIFWAAKSGKGSYPYYLVSATLLTYIAIHSSGGAFMEGIKVVLPRQHYADIVTIVVGIAFHISTCLFLLHLFQIFYSSEVCQFFVSHFISSS
ncbi:hypothetical protein DITRI_Ditri01bG0170000 [Diplodiscus trichospermus]